MTVLNHSRKSASRKVLILSTVTDPHSAAVSAHLEDLKAKVDFFRYEEFIQHCAMSFTLGSESPICMVERSAGDLDLQSYDSIWHRRPGTVVAGSFVEPWIRTMVEQEAHSALQGMFRSLSCVWMNLPANDFACTKLWQLQIANEIGFEIPETLVTNKPSLVKRFFEACNGEVIYKLLSEQATFNIPSSETPQGITTLPLRADDLPYLDQIVHAPHFFQRYVQKKCELRVTIVGKEIFAITIDSQAGQSKIDWRNDYSVDMNPVELPDHIKTKCLALMRQLGLNYGAIDFVLSKEDRYVFIELNCAGQYMWIEDRTPLKISLAIAKLLAGIDEPLVRLRGAK